MSVIEALARIHYPWLSRVSHRLARGEGVREGFVAQLGRFYELLTQSIETGDPAWMDALLDEWVQAMTQTEIEKREASLSPLLDELLQIMFDVARENLEAVEALDLSAMLLPVYMHVFEYTSRRETDLRIAHISGELEKARASLERLDKSKSDFIAIAAHELKTPLTLIEGYADMLREQMGEKDAQSKNNVLLNGIGNGTRRLRSIVDDMIDVSMIDNNLLSLNYQPIWLNRLFNVLQHEFETTIHERRLVMEIRPFPGCDEMNFADGERLFQALRNVLLNAIKYTPDGGQIIIDGRKLPGFVEITISDTGIGIDPEYHNLIFEKFGRLGSVSLHSSGKTKFKGGGPGLGLPIAKGIIEAHGGAIWVESEGYSEDCCPGTTFHILLPARKDPPDDRTARLFRSLLNAPADTTKK